jgi:hypothetical protein
MTDGFVKSGYFILIGTGIDVAGGVGFAGDLIEVVADGVKLAAHGIVVRRRLVVGDQVGDYEPDVGFSTETRALNFLGE